ncbi:MAG: hypothetical protein ISR65_14995 [Bacteriovoracaceae bacterium]|nr:hypothetical protein [Bacteriovoracaceae bacterium]
MAKNSITLEKLTGLSEQDLAEVFTKNPRAYMAVKGAVAEKHLEHLLIQYRNDGKIKSFTGASGDFDKDFYVTLNDGKTISLECKNIQVINSSTKKILPSYIQFLVRNNYLQENWLLKTFKSMAQKGIIIETDKGINSLNDLLEVILIEKAKTSTELLKFFPQELRESGIPRYEFSTSLIKESDVSKINIDTFIQQFDEHPLSIDFQRTRNSTDDDGDTKKQRFYKLDEIDVVAACLFSRTMKWQFIFGHSKYFTIHKKYKDRYANKFIIQQNKWSSDLLASLEIK